jgi:hypothetical protein
MRKVNRINVLTGFIMTGMCIVALAACGGRRAQPESVPANPPQATTAPQATAVPQKAQPTTAPAPAQPTAAPAVEQPTTTPEPAAMATVAAPAKSAESGAALEQVLEQLFNANSSADQLEDVPQVK